MKRQYIISRGIDPSQHCCLEMAFHIAHPIETPHQGPNRVVDWIEELGRQTFVWSLQAFLYCDELGKPEVKNRSGDQPPRHQERQQIKARSNHKESKYKAAD